MMVIRRERRMLTHLPTWTNLPFIGNAHKFFWDRRNLFKYYKRVSETIEATKVPFAARLGTKYFVVLSDPEEVRTVSTTNLNKAYIYNFTHKIIGHGLITAPGNLWKHNVKKLRSAFRPSNVDAFQAIFNDQSRELIKSLETEVDGGPFELQHKHLTNVTLRAVSQSALGVSADGDINGLQYYGKVSENDSTRSFIDILLEMRETDSTLTEEQIKSEVTTVLLAGQETTAVTVNFILLILGCRPDVQRKLYKEIRHVFGDIKRPVSKEDLGRLVYCEAVIHETLRLYPPVPAVLRYVDHDVELNSCTIPEGTTCIFNIWGSGRSKHIWGPDALLYKPERWLDPSTASKHVNALLNFSVGKRVCIGRRYAMNFIKTMLVHCLREYEFVSEADKMTLQMDVLLRPTSGNLLRIRCRGYNLEA
ncbi:unnamed protein product, partial [Iphiclides podalirius]